MVYLLYQLQEVIFMMGKQSGQTQVVILDIDSMIQEDRFLRRIKNCVNLDIVDVAWLHWYVSDTTTNKTLTDEIPYSTIYIN